MWVIKRWLQRRVKPNEKALRGSAGTATNNTTVTQSWTKPRWTHSTPCLGNAWLVYILYILNIHNIVSIVSCTILLCSAEEKGQTSPLGDPGRPPLFSDPQPGLTGLITNTISVERRALTTSPNSMRAPCYPGYWGFTACWVRKENPN